MLEPLDITGSVITIDAIGCQKTITGLIVITKADYVIDLKANQDSLYKQLSDYREIDGIRGPFCASAVWVIDGVE